LTAASITAIRELDSLVRCTFIDAVLLLEKEVIDVRQFSSSPHRWCSCYTRKKIPCDFFTKLPTGDDRR